MTIVPSSASMIAADPARRTDLQTSAMPVLFISLGTSPAVVPEACLLPGIEWQAVHVLTTEKPGFEVIHEFWARCTAGVPLSLTRVAGFDELRTEQDHFHFEEVLFRWVLDSGTRPEDRWFCLSGGFKTMSAAMQKAAAVFGGGGVPCPCRLLLHQR